MTKEMTIDLIVNFKLVQRLRNKISLLENERDIESQKEKEKKQKEILEITKQTKGSFWWKRNVTIEEATNRHYNSEWTSLGICAEVRYKYIIKPYKELFETFEDNISAQKITIPLSIYKSLYSA